MAPPINDAELRFRASLDDEVSPKVDRLEKRLKQMGASPAEIKMFLKAYDEATPKIKEAQKHVDRLPKEHHMHIRANAAEAERVMMKQQDSLRSLKREAEKPVKINFISNIQDVMNEVFTLRSRVPLPMAGAIPGANILYAGGLGAAAGAPLTAAAGMVQQGVQVNAQMEQSRITLEQTLKDQSRAVGEMEKLVEIAKTTPFEYKDVLAADVRLRSYQMPTMEGEGGPGGQGWLKLAGDMAAALNTPITQAVEAVADARQGYFVRMMTYGIRMMREDFEKGGKYAGLSYEQGLEKALRRFEGSQEMQAKSFQGLISNLKDIWEQEVIRPIGAPAFEVVRGQAQQMQDRFQDPEFQRQLADRIEEVQHRMIDMYNTVKEGKQYFQDNLAEPLKEVAVSIARTGKVFGEVFGSTTFQVLKSIALAIYGITKPLIEFVEQNPRLAQLYGLFKALSMLGFTNITSPFSQLGRSINPLTFSFRGLFSSISSIPGAIAKLGLLVLVKNFLDAKQASSQLNREFDKLGQSGLEKLNSDISKMSDGLGKSSTEMKKLVTYAGQGLPDEFKNMPVSPERRAQMSQRVAALGAALERDEGVDAKQAIKLILEEAKRGPKLNEEAFQKAANGVKKLDAAAEALDMSFRDVVRTMAQFQSQAQKVGLGGLQGAPYLAALTDILPDSDVATMLREYGRPSLDTLRGMASTRNIPVNLGPLGQISAAVPRGREDWHAAASAWEFRDPYGTEMGGGRGGRQARSARRFFGDIREQYEANERGDRTSRAFIQDIAPSANIPATPNPFLEQQMGADWDWIRQGAQGRGGSPREQAERMMSEWDRITGFIDEQAAKIAGITDELNKYTNQSQLVATATEDINLKMQQWQYRTLRPMQRDIEDAGLAMTKYAFNHMRPLERQMQALSRESGRLGENMRVAQYEMGKYSQGLLTGEQSALDSLHALERYNKQLQLLQLQYQSIGGQLGQTTFDAGHATRVAPLMGLNMQMQMERLRRRQQREQLEYELSYGEQHYELQQAARTRFQRQEMPFGDRLAGIEKNVEVIDKVTEAQHRMAGQQFQLQDRMAGVNEAIAGMQDNMTRLQITMQEAQQSDFIRGLQDESARLGLENADLQVKIRGTNVELARQESVMDDVKDQAQRLSDELNSLFFFDEGDPEGMARKMVNQAFKAGNITANERARLLKNIGTVTREINLAQTQQAVRTDQKWTQIVKEGVIGAFSGDLFRRWGDMIGAATVPKNIPFIGGKRIPHMGAVGDVVSTLGSFLGPLGLAGWGLYGAAGAAGVGLQRLGARAAGWATGRFPRAQRVVARVVGASERRWRGIAERLPEGRRQRFAQSRADRASRFLADFADNPNRAMANLISDPTRIGRQVRAQFNVPRRLLLNVVRTPATLIGGVLGGLGGGVPGAGAGAWAARRGVTDWIESRRVRDIPGDLKKLLTGNAEKIKEGVDDFGKKVDDFGKALARARSGANTTANKIGRAATRQGAGSRVFSRAVDIFKKAAGLLEDIFKHPGAVLGALAGIPIIGRLLRRGRGRPPRPPRTTEGRTRDREARAQRRAARTPQQQTPGGSTGRGFRLPTFLGSLVAGGFGLDALLSGDPKKMMETAISLSPAGIPLFGADLAFGGQDYGRMTPQQQRAARTTQRRQSLIHQQHSPVLDHTTDVSRRDPNIARWERIDLEKNRRQRIELTEEIRRIEESGGNADKQYRKLGGLQDEYNKKYKRAAETSRQEDLRNHKTFIDKFVSQLDDLGKDTIKLAKDRRDKTNEHEDKGGAGILDKTRKYLKAVDKEISSFAGKWDILGDTDVSKKAGDIADKANPFAHGGLVDSSTTDKAKHGGRIIKVAEEDKEMIIPLAPHRRERARSLLKQTEGMLGGRKAEAFANGGMVDRAYITAKSVYEKARMFESFANGGVVDEDFENVAGNKRNPVLAPGVKLRKPGMQLLARWLNDKLNTVIISGDRPGSRIAGSGGVSNHALFQALDIALRTPAPDIRYAAGGPRGKYAKAMDKLHSFLNTFTRSFRKDFLWRTMTGGNHFDHIHLGVQDRYANSAQIMGRVLAGGGDAADLRELIASLPAIAGGEEARPEWKKKVPRDIRTGVAGRAVFAAITRLQKKYNEAAEAVGGAAGGDLSDFDGSQTGRSVQKAISLGRRMAAAYGWTGPQWRALRELWQNESGWRWWADNPTSDAYGIPQALPGSKMASEGSDWKTNPATQIAWGLKYIKGRPDYGNPMKALQMWRSRSPHWYAQGGDVNTDAQLAILHRGERVLNPARAATQRNREQGGTGDDERQRRKLMNIIEDIQDKIKKAEQYLKKADDRAEKRKGATDLAALNEQLRRRFGQLREARQRQDQGLRRRISQGDESGGEATEALVRRETALYNKALKGPRDELKKAEAAYKKANEDFRRAIAPMAPAVRRDFLRARREFIRATDGTARTVRSAQERIRRLRRGGVTRRERGQIRRQRTIIGRARTRQRRARSTYVRARRRATRDLTPAQRRRVVRTDERALRARRRVVTARRRVGVARGRYLEGAARRGVNADLIREITGRPMSRDQRRAYERLERATRTGARISGSELRRLRATLRGESSRSRRDNARNAARSRAHRASTAARGRSHRAATAARGRAQRARVASGSARQRSRNAARARRTTREVRDSVSREGSRGRRATREVREETRRGRGDYRRHDDRRTRAEVNADRRERTFQRQAIAHLRDISRRGMEVTVHNEARGATLRTTVSRSRTRSR